ncbi:MAG: preprotein translocase subunit SecG [Caulobacteraceae bacterium]|nr:preprotein translocase subunit SecG [Caulobacteraceae bacterium]
MLFKLLLVLQIIVCIGLVAVILMQRSEGGALGMGGGGSGGFMTARGAGNLLTRTTAVLATLFFIISFGLTWVGNMDRRSGSLADDVSATAPANPAALAPVAPAAPAPTDDATPAAPGAAPANDNSLDSLAAPLPNDAGAPAPAAKK